jgi:hypothetical protein
MAKTIIIKNLDTEEKVWGSKIYQPEEEYSVPSNDQKMLLDDEQLFVDLVDKAQISNGTSIISNKIDAWKHISDGISTVEVTKIPDPAPFAMPLYRTKNSATSALITVAANSQEQSDYYITSERFASGGSIVVENAQFGDYVSAEVVDKDGIIPVPYRTALCESHPTVAKYIEKMWICPTGECSSLHLDTRPLTASIAAGLYLRVTYFAANAGSSRRVGINYFLTKKL